MLRDSEILCMFVGWEERRLNTDMRSVSSIKAGSIVLPVCSMFKAGLNISC